MALSAPEPIGANHQIRDFTSGVVSLDEWLKRRALANQASGAARTFVVCEADRVREPPAVTLRPSAIVASAVSLPTLIAIAAATLMGLL